MPKQNSSSQGVDHDGTTVQEMENHFKNEDDLSLQSLDEADFLVSSLCIAIGERDDAKLGVELGTTIRPNVKDRKNVDQLSLHSFDEADFLSDEDLDHQENPLPDKRLNHVMDYEAQALRPSSVRAVTKPCITNDVQPTMLHNQKRRDRQSRVTRFQKTLLALEQDLTTTKEEILNTNEYFQKMSRVKSQGQGRMGASLRRFVNDARGRRLQRIQADKYIRVNKDFIALIDVVENACRDDFNLTGLENWKREVKRLRMACRACTERIQPLEVCGSPPQVQPSQEKSSIQIFDLSQTEITHVVPFTTEDTIESPPLTPPTLEALHLNKQLPRALTPLNCITNGVVTHTWPETRPAVGYLPPPRLQPIKNMSADAKKLLQLGLEELYQDLSQTEITHVVPFTTEDTIESPPLTPPTLEALHLNKQLPRALTPLNCITNGVVTHTWPETRPAVGYLPPPRLQPIKNMSADAKKLLQLGLEELYQDLSQTEITHVVPFTTEDTIESPPLTPPTLEALHLNQQLPRALTPLNCVTNGVVTPTWPETRPAVGYLPPPRLQPIENMSADAKKLLQEGLEELQQDVAEEKKPGKGEKKQSGKGDKKQSGKGEETDKTRSNIKPLTVLEEKKKKKKNVGKRFLQWLSRKLICGCCS